MNTRTRTSEGLKINFSKRKPTGLTHPSKILDIRIKGKEESFSVVNLKSRKPRKTNTSPELEFLIVFQIPGSRKQEEKEKIWVTNTSPRLEKQQLVDLLETFASSLREISRTTKSSSFAKEKLRNIDLYCQSNNIRLCTDSTSSVWSDQDSEYDYSLKEVKFLGKRPESSAPKKLGNKSSKMEKIYPKTKDLKIHWPELEFCCPDELIGNRARKINFSKSNLKKRRRKIDPLELKHFVNQTLGNKIDTILSNLNAQKTVSKTEAFQYLTMLEIEIKQFLGNSSSTAG